QRCSFDLRMNFYLITTSSDMLFLEQFGGFMVGKQNTRTKQKPFVKLILTPPEPVERSVHALEAPQEAKAVCSNCGVQQSVLERHDASILHTHKRINAIVVQVPLENKDRFKAALRRKGFAIEDSKRVYPLLNDTVPGLHVPLIWDAGFNGASVNCAI